MRPDFKVRAAWVLVLLATVASGCSGNGTADNGELVDIPADHPASLVLEDAASFAEFSEVSREQGLEFACVSGGADKWEICLVAGNDLLAVVPFVVPSDLIGTVVSGDLENPVSFPLDSGIVGVSGIGRGVSLLLELDGQEIGSASLR